MTGNKAFGQAGSESSGQLVIQEVKDIKESWPDLILLFKGQADYHAPLLKLRPAADWQDLLLQRFLEGENLVFIARQDGRPVGFLSASTSQEDRLWDDAYVDVDNVYVEENHRGEGIGSALVRSAEEWAQARGIPKLELTVLANNNPAIAVWHNLGFSEMSHRMSKAIEIPA